MKKTISLKELSKAYVPSSLTVTGLCEYLKISEQHIRKWEEYFSLLPDTKNGGECAYSTETIKKFVKIKEHYDKGKSLKDLQNKIAGRYVAKAITVVESEQPESPLNKETEATNVVSETIAAELHAEKPTLAANTETSESAAYYAATAVLPKVPSTVPVDLKDRIKTEKAEKRKHEELKNNPFEKPELSSKKMPELVELTQEIPPSAALARPFLTQLNKANRKIEKLLSEKAKMIESTAVEKSRLINKIELLKAKNAELELEKEQLSITLTEKEQEVKKHFTQETVLSETLMITQEIFRKKEDEIRKLNGKIEKYERELTKKNNLIQKQDMEISEMLEKQKKRDWWKFWIRK